MSNEVWSRFNEAWDGAMTLPDGWRLRSLERNGTTVDFQGGRKEYIEWWEATVRGPDDEEITETGSWPVMALYNVSNAAFARAHTAAKPA